jgi:hypothetical protein
LPVAGKFSGPTRRGQVHRPDDPAEQMVRIFEAHRAGVHRRRDRAPGTVVARKTAVVVDPKKLLARAGTVRARTIRALRRPGVVVRADLLHNHHRRASPSLVTADWWWMAGLEMLLLGIGVAVAAFGSGRIVSASTSVG